MSGRADWYLSVGATASSAKTWQTSNLSRPRRPPEASPRASPRPTQTTCLPERDGKGTLTKHEKNKGGESRPYVKVTNTCARHAVTTRARCTRRRFKLCAFPRRAPR